MKAGEVVAGKYRLDKRLGIGGMGEVWSATHGMTGREFAIKFMHAHIAASETARQRFAREAQASARIQHSSIIDVYDVGSLDDGVLYLVMEMLDGVALADALHAVPPLSTQDFVAVLVDASRALAAAHVAGIVHRDIKPGNIFLHRERGSNLSYAKILDFGISKFSQGSDDGTATKTGSILGSPRYMSPEQTRSAANTDHRADLWAMGVMLFEGLTGTWPHEGDSFSSLVIAIATQPPASIDFKCPHLPEELRSIVRDCLKPLGQRLSSAEELALRLEDVLGRYPELGQIPLPKPLHPSGEGIRSTTGLRVRRPAASGEARAGTFPSGFGGTAAGAAPGGPPAGGPGQPRLPAPAHPPFAARWPDAGLSGPPAGAGGPGPGGAHSRGLYDTTSSTAAYAPPAPGGFPGGSSTVTHGIRPPVLPALPSAGDPLVASVSTMSVETVALHSPIPLPGAAPDAPAPSSPPMAPAKPPASRLALVAAALATLLVGLVIALVATLRGAPAGGDGTAPAALPGGPASASAAAVETAPTVDPSSAPSAVPAAPPPAPSASAAPPPSAAPTVAAAQSTSVKPTGPAVRPAGPTRPRGTKIDALGSGL